MPASPFLQPDGKTVLSHQGQDAADAPGGEIERLRAESALKDTEIERLRTESAAKDVEIERLRQENASLRSRLGEPKKTPRNSSIPPSRGEKADSGAKSARPKPRGRNGAHRPLCETPTRVENVLVETCPHCAVDVSAAPQEAVETYDHVEIPPIVPDVTRVVLHAGTCPCCRGKFKAAPPEGREPGSMFGPNLVALVLLLRHVGFVSFERLVMMLRCLFGVTVSEGGLANMLRRQVAAFAAQQERIRQDVRREKLIQSDETTLRVGKKRWQQWVFHNGLSCCFVAAASRAREVVETFLDGIRPEIWVSDRLGSAWIADGMGRPASGLPRASAADLPARDRQRRHPVRVAGGGAAAPGDPPPPDARQDHPTAGAGRSGGLPSPHQRSN